MIYCQGLTRCMLRGPPPPFLTCRRQTGTLSFLFWVVFGSPFLCHFIMCTPFLRHGMFNILVRLALTIFLHFMLFLYESPPPLDQAQARMFHAARSLCSSCKQNHPPHQLNVRTKNLCIVTTPWPRALNIYTLLKLSQSNFPLCFISDGFGLSGRRKGSKQYTRDQRGDGT